MINKKIIIGAALIFTLALQAGCSEKDMKNNSNEPVKPQTTKQPVVSEENKEKSIMDEFSTLTAKSPSIAEIFKFIDINISSLSKDNASIMINRLEEMQKANLSKLEEKFYADDTLQNKMNSIYTSDFDINKIDDVDDVKLKDLLMEVKDGGYRIETAEGMYFPIINYESLKKYSENVTSDLKYYIDIMTTESNNVPAKDAALVIGWDEVLKRALVQEKFIKEYPESVKIDNINQLYKKYVTFVFFGLNNTPLFSYDTKIMEDEAKSIYLKAAESDEDSKLLEKLRDFLDVLNNNRFKLTDEVDEHRKLSLEDF